MKCRVTPAADSYQVFHLVVLIIPVNMMNRETLTGGFKNLFIRQTALSTLITISGKDFLSKPAETSTILHHFMDFYGSFVVDSFPLFAVFTMLFFVF